MSPSHEITHVSDTALMVAACRAIETEDVSGFVRDPFAARLAGARGMALLRTMPQPEWMCFGIAVRSYFMDRLVLQMLAAHSIATVLNVGCGLDTRPWRLDLPADLRWIEVDFADMLDYKDALLAGETPGCRRERLTVDLNDAAQRQSLYAAAGDAPAFLITEGLLMYLPAGTVEAWAQEIAARCGVAWWMSEITTSHFSQAIGLETNRPIRSVQAADFLEGGQILDCLARHGWVTAERRSYLKDMAFAGERIARMMGPRPPGPSPVAGTDPSGIHVFARA